MGGRGGGSEVGLCRFNQHFHVRMRGNMERPIGNECDGLIMIGAAGRWRGRRQEAGGGGEMSPFDL